MRFSAAMFRCLLFFEEADIKNQHEYQANHARWLGGPTHASQGTEWPQPVPLVQSGSSQGPPRHLLFGVVRGRMAGTERSRLYSRKSTGTRPWRLRRLRCGLPACRTAIETSPGRSAPESISRLGTSRRIKKDPVGRRSHRSGGGGWRRVRFGKYPHVVSEVPSRGDSGIAQPSTR
jgi:hypothetical protein